MNLRSLKVVELKDDDNFIAKDEAKNEFVVFKGQEIKSFKTLLEAKEYFKGRWRICFLIFLNKTIF